MKRQTVNAMKYMQQLVRVQSQIQSRRIKTLENKAQAERDEAKWAAASEAGNGNWDDSVLTKEERDARSQRKTDAVIKRERSMAYAYSHKVTTTLSVFLSSFVMASNLVFCTVVEEQSQVCSFFRWAPSMVELDGPAASSS